MYRNESETAKISDIDCIKNILDMSVSTMEQGFVKVLVTSSTNSFGSERRFDKNISIAELKGKLELLTGSLPCNMKLQLRSKEGKFVKNMANDDELLESYLPDDGMIIHVEDSTLPSGEFEDLSKVEKYELPDSAYAERTDSVRAFKERNKLGRFADPEAQAQKLVDTEQLEKSLAEKIKVGFRCQVTVPKQPVRLGTVMFVGRTEFQSGYWVGVKLDEPLGKNDGSVKGNRYFECEPKYGSFVRPSQVTVGNFAEEGLDELEEM